jgi:hypothetical protein
MTVKELREALSEFPDDMEVMTKKTEFFGNIGNIFSVRLDSYGFFGHDIPCVLLTDESNDEEESDD